MHSVYYLIDRLLSFLPDATLLFVHTKSLLNLAHHATLSETLNVETKDIGMAGEKKLIFNERKPLLLLLRTLNPG